MSEKSDIRSGVEGTEGGTVGIADIDKVDSMSERIDVDEVFLRRVTSDDLPARVGDCERSKDRRERRRAERLSGVMSERRAVGVVRSNVADGDSETGDGPGD